MLTFLFKNPNPNHRFQALPRLFLCLGALQAPNRSGRQLPAGSESLVRSRRLLTPGPGLGQLCLPQIDRYPGSFITRAVRLPPRVPGSVWWTQGRPFEGGCWGAQTSTPKRDCAPFLGKSVIGRLTGASFSKLTSGAKTSVETPLAPRHSINRVQAPVRTLKPLENHRIWLIKIFHEV